MLHRSLRMLKQIESSTGIRITTASGPQYHHEIEAQFIFFFHSSLFLQAGKH